MGSSGMESDDGLAHVADQTRESLGNVSKICIDVGRIYSGGVFHNHNPLSFTVPLVLLQMSLASGIILGFSFLLKRLGQPIVVSQLLGAIILGPSVLGRCKKFSEMVFPLRGFVTLDSLASFGYIFYFFLIGVQTDVWILKRLQRKSYALGLFAVAVPIVLNIPCLMLVMKGTSLEQTMRRSLPVVAQAESVLAFPVVAQFLTELKIINTEFGRVALSSSVVSTLCSIAVITTTLLWRQGTGHNFNSVGTFVNSFFLSAVIVLVVRPMTHVMIKRNPQGQPLKEKYIITILIAVLITVVCSQVLGLHLYLGPLILGVIIPAGPPAGSTLVDKLDLMVNWLFIPLFFVRIGLKIDVFDIQLKNYLIVQFLSLVGAYGKFMGTFVIALCFHIPPRDAVCLGLVMTAQGALELGMMKMMRESEAINNESLASMCLNMIFLTGTITPIIRYLYDPARRYIVYARRTVMHLKPNSELRVLVCIHDQENVPTSISFLEAINPTKQSPLVVYAVHLIELVGRTNPILIPHKLRNMPSRKAKHSEHVVNAFRRFEDSKQDVVSVHSFTAISPYKTMHDDVCTIALEKGTALVIIPFYKRPQAASGTLDFYNKCIKITNDSILEKAPCSIGILVDRGLLDTSRPYLDSWSSYRVAVLFFGGADDREALAIAARMAGHDKIHLTVIRLVENGSVSSDESEKRLDDEMASKFRTATETNTQLLYIEEVVMDGTGTISVIRSMEDNYELVIVGRHHDVASPLLSGLIDWNYEEELGIIGEVLASAQFMDKTTVLVVQQQINISNGVQNGRTNITNSQWPEDDEDDKHIV